MAKILNNNIVISDPSSVNLTPEILENTNTIINGENGVCSLIVTLHEKEKLVNNYVLDIIDLLDDMVDGLDSDFIVAIGLTAGQLEDSATILENELIKIDNKYSSDFTNNGIIVPEYNGGRYKASMISINFKKKINEITSSPGTFNIKFPISNNKHVSTLKNKLTGIISDVLLADAQRYLHDLYERNVSLSDDSKPLNMISADSKLDTLSEEADCIAKTNIKSYVNKSLSNLSEISSRFNYIIEGDEITYPTGKAPYKSFSSFSTYVKNKITSSNSSILDSVEVCKSYIDTLKITKYKYIPGTVDLSESLGELVNIHYTNNIEEINNATDMANKSILDAAKSIAANWYTGGKSWVQSCANDGVFYTIKQTTTDIAKSAYNFISGTASKIIEFVNNPTSQQVYDTLNDVVQTVDGFANTVEDMLTGTVDNATQLANTAGQLLQETITNYNDNGASSMGRTISSGLGALATSLTNYVDGITETVFGTQMEKSWRTDTESFINTFYTYKRGAYKVNFVPTSPLDPSDKVSNFYGTMMLGTPPLFTNVADPNSRAYINSFLKDSKFLVITPGLPKYSGGAYDGYMGSSNLYNQTKNGDTQMQYLLRNGIDSFIAGKDKRYYSFEANYTEYFSYLETMLNTIRIKMGLATDSNNTYNLYSFIDPANNQLRSKYKNSLGFYINPAGMLSELIDSSQTTFGSEQASRINSTSADSRRTNYMTGMGTGSGWHNASRLAANTINGVLTAKQSVQEFFQIGSSMATAAKNATNGSNIAGLVGFAAGAILDAARNPAMNDTSALIQQFATQNGMKVMYPELWEDSNYSKNVSVNFEFISPYGDPESIFEHVMVPFCALLCLAMPRQADYNGLVSPFFVRADVSGMFSIDLGMISNISFNRGGNNDLWTKDGLPLAISGSIQLLDLYPFLAMTKRLSYLSANPNYTSFLNSFAGLHIINKAKDANDSLSIYFQQLLNRMSGLDNTPQQDTMNNLWNAYNTHKKNTVSNNMKISRTNKLAGLNTRSINFMKS